MGKSKTIDLIDCNEDNKEAAMTSLLQPVIQPRSQALFPLPHVGRKASEAEERAWERG